MKKKKLLIGLIFLVFANILFASDMFVAAELFSFST